MDIKEDGDTLVITTTDLHLPQRSAMPSSMPIRAILIPTTTGKGIRTHQVEARLRNLRVEGGLPAAAFSP